MVTNEIISLDAEIDRLAHLIAQRLVAKIKARVSIELGDGEDLFGAEPAPHASVNDLHLPVEESTSVEVFAGPDVGRGPSCPDVTAIADTSRVLPSRESDSLEEIREAAQAAIALGFNAGDAVRYCEELLGGPVSGNELGIELFRCAVRLETRARRDEERQAREKVAANRRLAKMEERRSKIEAKEKIRQANMVQKAASHSQVPVEPKVRTMVPIVEASRKRVVIVGLLPAQSEMINQEFRSFFEFAFFGSDRIGGIKNVINHADGVLVMTDFVSHAHLDQIHGASLVERVRGGGMSSLRKALREYYAAAYGMPILQKNVSQ